MDNVRRDSCQYPTWERPRWLLVRRRPVRALEKGLKNEGRHVSWRSNTLGHVPSAVAPRPPAWKSTRRSHALPRCRPAASVTPITFHARDVLWLWLIVSGSILIGWGINRIYNVLFNKTTILVGQDTTNTVTAMLAITFTIAAIIIEK